MYTAIDQQPLKRIKTDTGPGCGIFQKVPKNSAVNLQFADVTYDVIDRVQISKNILNGVSGEFRAGELSAIMGPSGCGKTTLLNILAGYRIFETSGFVNVNDIPRNMKEFRKISRYVLQEDNISPHFTVMETLQFASNFKLNSSYYSKKQRQTVINEYLDIFLLQKKANTMISHLSGGERKRVCVALELLNNPAVLFLDEPTTGLDEFSASQSIRLLKRLAMSGHTVICSIHCPSARLFQMFDKIYGLSEGQCIYQGSGNDVVSYLRCFNLHCPITYNPADFLIEVTTYSYGNFQNDMVHEMKNGKIIKWSPNMGTDQAEISQGAYSTEDDMDVRDLNENLSASNCLWWSEYWWILRRITRQMWRDKTNLKLTIITHIFLATLLGFAYWNIGNDAHFGLFNYNFAVLNAVQFIFLSMSPMFVYVPVEMLYLRREYFNQWYRFSSYFMALLTSQLLVLAMLVPLSSIIMYFLAGQPLELFRFLLFVGITVLTSMVASSYGMLIGSRFRLMNALFMGPNILAVWIMLANYAVERTHIHLIEHIIMYTSFVRHSVEGLMASLFRYNRPDLICPSNRIICLGKKPEFVLKLTGNMNISYIRSVAFLIGFYLMFTILAFVIIKFRLSAWESLARNRQYRYVKHLFLKHFYSRVM